MKLVKILAASVLVMSSAEAATWYAKAANYGQSGLDGRSEATAWGTLQDAHDNAATGDTIRVLPGDYNQGTQTASDGVPSRLVVSKKLIFESTVPKAAHIVGVHDTTSESGLGSGAVRCICVTTAGYGTIFKDFTIRDGATRASGTDPMKDETNGSSTGTTSTGGGLIVYGARGVTKTSNPLKVYLVDCVVSNCVAQWGGVMHGGTAIRCLLKDNAGASYGGAATMAALWNTVIVGNKALTADRPVLGNYARAINCTLSGCMAYGAQRSVFLWNCVFVNQESTEMATGADLSSYYPSTYTNCYGRASDVHPVISPATGDFRPRTGSPIVGGCRMADMTQNIVLPDGIEMTDFNGNPIDLTQATCDAGAVQGAVAPQGGRVDFSDAVVADGFSNIRPSYSYAVDGVAAVKVESVSGRICRLSLSGSTGGVPYRYADGDGVVTMPYPSAAGAAVSASVALLAHEYWCNPSAPAATADGSAAHPFPTLQAAMDLITDGKCGIVHAAAGTYAEGSSTPSGQSLASRVAVPGNVLLEGAGADRTFIVGAHATAGADTYGRGNDAVHCVYLNTGATLKGFTVTGGATKSGWSDNNAAQPDWHGAGVHSPATTAAASAQTRVEDCVVSNCVATCGGAGYGVTFVRSRLLKCRAVRGSATEQCGLVNTIVDDMDSEGGAGICVSNSYPIDNTTVGPNIRKDSGGTAYALCYQSTLVHTEYGVVNTVILGYVATVTAMTNCVFTSASGSSARVNCRTLTAGQIAIDGEYRPDRATSALVDQGLTTDRHGETDIYGGQRVYNGIVDIGAVEADWRGKYAADLSKKKSFKVTAATPGVVETGSGAVQLTAGETFAARWNGNNARRHYAVTLDLATDSAVTVTLNGASTTYDTVGRHEFTFDSADTPQGAFQIACTSGTADILAADVFIGSTISFR